MSLSSREQQALDSLEGRLSACDPGLASLLATFTRLTSGDDMPAREMLGPKGRRHPWRGRPRRKGWTSRLMSGLGGRPGWQWAVLLWLGTAMMLILTALILGRGGRGAHNAGGEPGPRGAAAISAGEPVLPAPAWHAIRRRPGMGMAPSAPATRPAEAPRKGARAGGSQVAVASISARPISGR